MELHELTIEIESEKFDRILLTLAQEGIYTVTDWIFTPESQRLKIANLSRKTIRLINDAVDALCIDSLPTNDKEKSLLNLVPQKWIGPIIREEVRQWFISRSNAIALKRSFAEEGGHISIRREVTDFDYLQEPFRSYVKAEIQHSQSLD